MKLKRGTIHTINIRITVNTEDSKMLKISSQEERNAVKGIRSEVDCRMNEIIITLEIDLYLFTGLDYINETNLPYVDGLLSIYMSKYFNFIFDDHIVTNLDYSFDYELTSYEMALFLKMLREKTMDDTNRYAKVIVKSTIYFNSCMGKERRGSTAQSKVLRIYDKYKKDSESKYINNLRFEISLKKRHLYYKEYSGQIDRNLTSYLNEELSISYFIKELTKVIYTADFMTYSAAIMKIRGSNLSSSKRCKEKFFDE